MQQQITYKQVIVAGLLKITVSMMNERRVKRRANILSFIKLIYCDICRDKSKAKSGN